MTAPIVVVSRDDTRDPLLIEWFENENGYYNEDPVAWVSFDPVRDEWTARAKRHAQGDTRLSAARLLLALVLDSQANVTRLATHRTPEPGAPLEPIPGRAA